MRGLRLPSGRRAILSDTVGFISELPTELVAAFRATLEEVAEADVILHVRDAAHPDTAAQRADVIAVLDGMVADGTLDAGWPARTIEVLNKADLLGGVARGAAAPGRGRRLRDHRRGSCRRCSPRSTRASPRGWRSADYDIPPQPMARGWPGCTSTARWSDAAGRGRGDPRYGAPAAGRPRTLRTKGVRRVYDLSQPPPREGRRCLRRVKSQARANRPLFCSGSSASCAARLARSSSVLVASTAWFTAST